jgi:DnaA family protein
MLQPLSDAGMRYALDREAQRQGLTLPDEVLDYLLGHFERDLSKLMAVLHQLDRFALARKRPATVPLLKRMLAEEQQDGWDESRSL